MSQTTTAIFLWIGFDAERRLRKADFPETNGGFLDIVDSMDKYATVVERWYDKHVDLDNPNWPGCFDYEVTEGMGAWIFNNFESCTRDFEQELNRYTASWVEENKKAYGFVAGKRHTTGGNEMTPQEKRLMAEIPHMNCKNKTEFSQRLQWLSEGMLRNHMESVQHYQIDLDEVARYREFKEST